MFCEYIHILARPPPRLPAERGPKGEVSICQGRSSPQGPHHYGHSLRRRLSPSDRKITARTKKDKQ